MKEGQHYDTTLPQHRERDEAPPRTDDAPDDVSEDLRQTPPGVVRDEVAIEAAGEGDETNDDDARETRPRPRERDRDRDPDHSSLSAMSHISTGLSVDSDADSAMGDMSSLLSTTSIRSSIYEFVEEHGRTFHRYKQGKYWMPNDQIEQERLDLQHAVFMMLLKGKPGLAPIQNPQQVLDLGTGTGIWAIDFG